MLQEFLNILPSSYEFCANCGCVYDSDNHGIHHDCEDCDNMYCEEYYNADCDDKAALNGKNFCCGECESEFLSNKRDKAKKVKEGGNAGA